MENVKKPSNIEELVKKAAGITERPKIIQLEAGGIVLDVEALTDDEIFETIERLQEIVSRKDGGFVDECKITKELIYTHCSQLREYAASVQNENRAEPWDVVEEIFTADERNDLRIQLYKYNRLDKFFVSDEKNG